MRRFEPGTTKAELDTPVLCLDLEAMDRNRRAMADCILGGGKDWRPHAKSHKSPAVAHTYLRDGAIGMTCAKLAEAEVMAAGGVTDVLVANMLVGRPKLERLAALCRHANPVVAVDHFAQMEPMAAVCRERGVSCRVLVEVDIGMNRVGIRPGKDALDLARAVDRLDGLELVGLMGYEGHLLTVPDAAEKRERIEEAIGVLVHTAGLLREHDLPCEIVSAGGTGSFRITSACEGVTEIQAGGGIFGDPFYTDTCHVDGLEPALTVLTTVVSRPALDRAVVDAGRKTVNADLKMPHVQRFPDAEVTGLSAEHGRLRLGPDSRDLRIGDRIELVVGYSDFTLVLHDWIHGFRDDRLEVVWPIAARGLLH